MQRRPHHRGFTLLELLVVIGIIAVLIGLLFTSMRRVREHARTVTCASNLRQLVAAAKLYSVRYDRTMLPARHLPGSGAGWWPSILLEEKLIDVPSATDAEVAAGRTAMSWGILFCPSGEQSFFPPDLTNNTAVPANRQDPMAMRAYRMRNPRQKVTVDCWYGINADRGDKTDQGPAVRAIDSSSDVYLREANIRSPSDTVMLYDGLIYHQMAVNANRLNARHGFQTLTNIGFFDGHVETIPTATLPGGLGAAKPADFTALKTKSSRPKWWLEQGTRQ